MGYILTAGRTSAILFERVQWMGYIFFFLTSQHQHSGPTSRAAREKRGIAQCEIGPSPKTLMRIAHFFFATLFFFDVRYTKRGRGSKIEGPKFLPQPFFCCAIRTQQVKEGK